jgi:hypothetical protein
MLLSIPITRSARESKKATNSEPIKPLEPVTSTLMLMVSFEVDNASLVWQRERLSPDAGAHNPDGYPVE